MLTPRVQTISTKGQIVIPAKFREMLGLVPMGKVSLEIFPSEKKLVLSPMENIIEELSGVLKHRGKNARTIKTMIRKEEASIKAKKYGKIYS